MKHLTRARPSAAITTVLIALTLPTTLGSLEHGAQANPITCCNLDLRGVANSTHLTLIMRLRKPCIAQDPCPAADRVRIWRNGEPLLLTWSLEDKATTCNYTAQDELIALENNYRVEMEGVKDCLTGNGTIRTVDAGPPDLTAAQDAAQDMARRADATHLPPAGGDTGCAVGPAGLPSPSGLPSPLGVVVPLSLLALGVILRRRRRP